MKCTTCHSAEVETRVVHEYHADLLGAPFGVYLMDAVTEQYCTKCGRKLKTVIPDLDGLLHAVARARAVESRKLSGPEIKFLRHAVGCKAKYFAEKLEMTAENLSRVENGTKPLGPQSEKLLRFYVLTKLIDENFAEKIGKAKLNEIFDMKIEAFWDPNEVLEMRFERVLRKEDEQGTSEDNKKYVPVSKAA